MKEMFLSFIGVYDIFVLAYFVILNITYLMLLVLAAGQLFKYKQLRRISYSTTAESPLAPEVTILAPAYNEELTIAESVKCLLKIEYEKLQITVINDGSKDGTLDVLKENFRLVPAEMAVEENLGTKRVRGLYRSAADERLLVVDKENGGKADALNAGINHSSGRLFCAVDADTLIERDALRKLVHGYIHRGSKVIALGGIVRLANDCVMESGQVVEPRLPRNLTAAFQAMEYIRAFLCGRAGWNSLNSLLIISGAFGLFDRKEVISAGGYDAGTVGEDMELIVRLHRIMRENRRPYSVIFLPDPVCWTQAPESLRVLGRQRNRWQSGLIQTLIRHRAMIANPRYGPPGTLGMTYNLLFEALGPVVELSGYVVVAVSWLFGVVSGGFMVLFLMVAVMFGLLLSVGALVLEEFTVKKYSNTEDLLKLLFLALLENFGYRQINAWWRLKAIVDLLRGRVSWGEMERKAFAKQ